MAPIEINVGKFCDEYATKRAAKWTISRHRQTPANLGVFDVTREYGFELPVDYHGRCAGFFCEAVRASGDSPIEFAVRAPLPATGGLIRLLISRAIWALIDLRTADRSPLKAIPAIRPSRSSIRQQSEDLEVFLTSSWRITITPDYTRPCRSSADAR